VFDENVFPFSQLNSNAGAQLHAKILLLPPGLCNFDGDDVVAGHLAHGANPVVVNDGVQTNEISEEQAHIAHGIGSSMDLAATANPAESSSDSGSSNRPRSAPDPMPTVVVSSELGAAPELDTRQVIILDLGACMISSPGLSTPSGSTSDFIEQEILTSAQDLQLLVQATATPLVLVFSTTS
jgi:hypothetical protein